jgi:excisionase family DNA binding protein
VDGIPAGEADALDLRHPGGRMMNSSGTKIPKFFTVKQVAERLEISIRTVWRWIQDGELIVHRFRGSVRVAEADLNAFIAARRSP